MARKKSSVLEDLVELVAMLPWWVGVSLALILYVMLSNYAAQPAPPLIMTPGSTPDITPRIFKSLALGLQYILPLLALMGAAISLFKRHKRNDLIESTEAGGQNVLDDISWQEFEILVGEAFRRKGYSVEESGGGGADGGVDLVMRKDGEKSLVQCKQWRANTVGVSVVRELYGVMAASRASHGYVVTSGRFTADAIKFAAGREVDLIDGEKLNRMIREIKSQGKSPVPAATVVMQQSDEVVSNVDAPACPKCGTHMVKRTAQRGANAGKQFWGCSRYPSCRGVRTVA